MKVWTITGFEGHWPVGTVAVVVAESDVQAALLLNNDLEAQGLRRSVEPEHLERLSTSKPMSKILNNGDY